jgi:hypothetical protein
VSFSKVSRRALLYGTPAVAGAALLAPGSPAAAAPVDPAAVAAGRAVSPKDEPYNAKADGTTDDTRR